ncbi:hypothetical protein [Streptomyces zhihengii]
MTDLSPDLAFTESRTMRAQTADRIDVLDKVKALALLPDGMHATVEGVASYFEVEIDAVKSVVRRHREELEGNGLRKLTGEDLRQFVRVSLTPANGLSTKARSLHVFTRRAILNVAQLLTESDVARQVRTYLLEVEEQATPEQRATAIEKAEEAEAQLRAIEVLARIEGNSSYARSISRHIAARMLGEEPELDSADITITCDEYLIEKGVAAADMQSARTRMGKTVAALYRARYGKDPQKIDRPIHGVHRKVAVYTHRDIDLFDKAWSEVGRHYDIQTSFGDAA